MSKFSSRINRFFLRHRNKGIPNLMLYIVLGNALVTILSLFNGGDMLYYLLCFDKAAILQGQVWRLVTFIFTEFYKDYLGLIFLYFFYSLGRQVELSIGTLKFNLFYFTGVVLMAAFAMLMPGNVPVLYAQMTTYLHLSLVLAYATTNPDAQFLILFIIPVKAWVIALLDMLLIGAMVFNLSFPVFLFPYNLFPLAGLANYFIFFWDSLPNLLPLTWRTKLRRRKKAKGPKVIHFEQQAGPYRTAPKKADYLHKCTVCGRTDTTDPGLEFRYCSRCSGYHCYCIDHINNHTHVE